MNYSNILWIIPFVNFSNILWIFPIYWNLSKVSPRRRTTIFKLIGPCEITLTVKNLEDFPLPLRFNELFWPKKTKKVEWNIGYLMLGKSLRSAPKVLGCTWCISCLFSPMLVWVFAGDLGWKALNFFFILQLAHLAIHFFCKTCKLRNPFYER